MNLSLPLPWFSVNADIEKFGIVNPQTKKSTLAMHVMTFPDHGLGLSHGGLARA